MRALTVLMLSLAAAMLAQRSEPLTRLLILAGVGGLTGIWLGAELARARLGARVGGSLPPIGRGEALAVAAIVALGAFLRWYRLGDLPYWPDYDEVQNGWIGCALLGAWGEHGYQPVLSAWARGNPTPFFYLQGLALSVSHDLTMLRAPAALAGTLTVPFVYLLAAELVGRRPARWAALVVALWPMHLLLSRVGKQPVVVPLVLSAGLWLIARGLRAAGRARAAWLAAAGATFGLGLHSYEAFLPMPLVAALWVGWELRADRDEAWRALRPLLAGLAIVALPLVAAFVWSPATVLGHVSGNLGELGMGPLERLRSLVDTLAYVLLEWPALFAQQRGRLPNAFQLAPLWLTAGVVALGWSAWRRWRGGAAPARPPADPLVGALASASPPLLLTLAVAAPAFLLAVHHTHSPRRYVAWLPVAAILIGWLLARATAALERLGGPVAGWLAGLALLVALLAGLRPAMAEYGRAQQPPPQVERAALLRWVLAAASDRPIVLCGDLAGDDWWSRLALAHPRVRAAPASWPGWPQRREEAGALWIARRDLGLPGARRLELPLGAAGVRRLAVLELPHPGHRADGSGWLLVPVSGLARVEGGQLAIDGVRSDVQGWLPVAIGPRRVERIAGAPRLRWPDGRLAPLPLERPGRLGSAPPALRWSAQRVVGRPQELEVATAFGHPAGGVLDAAFAADGSALLGVADVRPLWRWRPAGLEAPDWLQVDGEAWRLRALYGGSVGGRRLSLAPRPEGGLIGLERSSEQPRLLAFEASGRGRELPSEGLIDPSDVALGEGRIWIADPGCERVWCWWQGTLRPALDGVDPVSVAASGGRLALLDRSDGALLLCQRRGQRLQVQARVELGTVDARCRLDLTPSGRVLLCDPTRGRLLLVEPDGRLDAAGGDASWLGRLLTALVGRPLVAALDEEHGRLLIASATNLVIARLELEPRGREPLELSPGSAPEARRATVAPGRGGRLMALLATARPLPLTARLAPAGAGPGDGRRLPVSWKRWPGLIAGEGAARQLPPRSNSAEDGPGDLAARLLGRHLPPEAVHPGARSLRWASLGRIEPVDVPRELRLEARAPVLRLELWPE